MFDLSSDLLHAAEMPGKKLVDSQICHFFDQSARGAGCTDFILGKNSPIGNAEILHQFLFSIMCNQSDSHL